MKFVRPSNVRKIKHENPHTSPLLFLIMMSMPASYAGALEVEPTSEAQISRIKMALGDQYPVQKILAVKSTIHSRAYYVGAAFYTEGVGKAVGLWLMSSSKEEPRMTLSVDDIAYEFSRLGKASESKAGGSVTDLKAKALKKALEN